MVMVQITWADERRRAHKARTAAEDEEEIRFIKEEIKREQDKIEAKRREAYEVSGSRAAVEGGAKGREGSRADNRGNNQRGTGRVLLGGAARTCCLGDSEGSHARHPTSVSRLCRRAGRCASSTRRGWA